MFSSVRLSLSSDLRSAMTSDAALRQSVDSDVSAMLARGGQLDVVFDKVSTTHVVIPSHGRRSVESVGAERCGWASVVFVGWLARCLQQLRLATAATDADMVQHDAARFIQQRNTELHRYRDRALWDVQAHIDDGGLAKELDAESNSEQAGQHERQEPPRTQSSTHSARQSDVDEGEEDEEQEGENEEDEGDGEEGEQDSRPLGVTSRLACSAVQVGDTVKVLFQSGPTQAEEVEDSEDLFDIAFIRVTQRKSRG